MAGSRVLQLGALVGAAAAGVAVYLFVGGTAGLLYAGAALVLGAFLIFRLRTPVPVDPTDEFPGGRWFGKRARIAALEDALADEQERVAERETEIVVLRRGLDDQRRLTQALEQRFRQQLAELEAEHEAAVDRVVSGVDGLEDELAAVERFAEELTARAAAWTLADRPQEGAVFRSS